VAALFFGPPGTGKTMAASIIGTELGMEVFQVDLSRVVDKYRASGLSVAMLLNPFTASMFVAKWRHTSMA
jgi:ATP-dependent 26S proteasome regulatory subunit